MQSRASRTSIGGNSARRNGSDLGSLLALAREKSRRRARSEPELAAAGGGERSERFAETLGVAARGSAEAIVAGLELSELQQAVAEIEPARRVLRRQHQAVTIKS